MDRTDDDVPQHRGARQPRRGVSARALVAISALLLASCAGAEGTLAPAGDPTPDGPPPLDAVQVEEGDALYATYCASCHGADLAGTANWKVPGPDGAYPPPPHDDSGHTWHHGDGLLLDLIRDGSPVEGSTMPAFGDTLSDDQIRSILEYLKSNWGPDQRTWQWQATVQESER